MPRDGASAASAPTTPAPTAPTALAALFPDCTPMHLPPSAVDTCDERFEFWDAATETAWVAEGPGPYHERASRRLDALVNRIAAERGSPIECYGTMALALPDAHGAPRRILRADEALYVHPGRARLPGPKAMVVGEHDFPDVVLEVDHTTDGRRGKLGLYEAWGFPEVWGEVPDRDTEGRMRRRRAGLTIHRLAGGAYRAAAESTAFPGCTAAEIHTGLKRDGRVGNDVRGAAPGRRGARRARRHGARRRPHAALAPGGSPGGGDRRYPARPRHRVF